MSEGPGIKTIEWVNGAVRIIDQTRLPTELVYVTFDEHPPLVEAIQRLRIRGAPAIGIAAALGVTLGTRKTSAETYEEFCREFEKISSQFLQSRPTGVNLSNAIHRLKGVVKGNKERSVDDLKDLLEQEALRIFEQERAICRGIGRNGCKLIEDGWTILTHCNAGALATVDYGTALGCIYAAANEGKGISVCVDETRPLLQGARLTAWELRQAGIDVTLICDSMAAWIMKNRKVDCVIVGADRIVANGDVANKIGTYSLAVLASQHGIPFYVAAPTTTFDLSMATGDSIPIEERDASEITESFGRRSAPVDINVYNPSFDVTPAELITAIVCESGIATPPYKESLSSMIGM